MEEAPTPSKPEMNIEPKGQIEHLKKFEAKYKENIKYEISIYKIGSHLIIATDVPKDSQKIKYSNYYDIDTLKQNNKFLALCDNIDDIIDTIYDNATNFSCNINENYNDYEIKIPVPVKNLKEINFILKEKKKTQSEIINDLIEKCNLQDKKINELEMRVKSLEDENKKIKDDFKELLKNEISGLKVEIVKMKEVKPIINSDFKIINYDSFKKLNDWINPNRSLQFQLIFRASKDGDSSGNFHKICNGKGPSVTIVKGKNGHIFGGYVTVPFSSDNKIHYDENAFLFSLTNLKKIPIKIKDQAVCHYSGWGPYIGYKDHCDLAIDNGCLNKNSSYCEPKSYDFNRIDLIGTNQKNFGVSDYEVYLVN